MIDRRFLGKTYPPFFVCMGRVLSQHMHSLYDAPVTGDSSSQVDWPPPANWPALLTLHGSACLVCLWEDLGIDPRDVYLVAEHWELYADPIPDEEMGGYLEIVDLSEHVEPHQGIMEQLDLKVVFRNSRGVLVAEYACSYRIPAAIMVGGRAT